MNVRQLRQKLEEIEEEHPEKEVKVDNAPGLPTVLRANEREAAVYLDI